MNLLDRVLNMFKRRKANASAWGGDPFDWTWQDRNDDYLRWLRSYEGKRYDSANLGGDREEVLREILERDNSDLFMGGFFMPIKPIVTAYDNIFWGRYGRDFYPVDDVGRSFDNEFGDVLDKIWRDSNLHVKKSLMHFNGALFGTFGLRIIANGQVDKPYVRIVIDQPHNILDYAEDSRGNVTEVLLEYEEMTGPLGEQRKSSTVREWLSKDVFRRERNGQLEEEIPNEMGFCPYVIVKHVETGHDFGKPAFSGTERAVDMINFRISRQDEAIDRNLFPKWFATGGGSAPTEFEFGIDKVIHVQSIPDEPPATLNALVPQLQHQQVQSYWDRCIELYRQAQPELVLSDIKALSGQSGETIAKLLTGAMSRIESARTNYEAGLVKSMQMACSWSILLGLANVGTGQGTREAADRAWDNGDLDFDFNARPAIAPTSYDRIQIAIADSKSRSLALVDATAAGGLVSDREKLRWMGYNAKQIEDIEEEKATQDIIPVAPDGTAPNDPNRPAPDDTTPDTGDQPQPQAQSEPPNTNQPPPGIKAA